MTQKKKYINSDKFCIICSEPPEVEKDGNSVRPLKLIKHHVKYSPEEIMWVHYKCHLKIHDPDKPLKLFIQYAEEERKTFYSNKTQNDKTLGTITKWKL